MKLISESEIMEIVSTDNPKIYFIPEGCILSPAAKDFLNRKTISYDTVKNRYKYSVDEQYAKVEEESKNFAETNDSCKSKYIDYITGNELDEKPEWMTHLHNSVLVPKNSKRIVFRGKLDKLQAEITCVQNELVEETDGRSIVDELEEILSVLREIMECDALDKEFSSRNIMHMNHGQIRERSHNADKYFGIKKMQPPHYSMGKVYAKLNYLRTSIREVELAAVEAFYIDGSCERKEIVEEFNMLSSILHIMMCKYLSNK